MSWPKAPGEDAGLDQFVPGRAPDPADTTSHRAGYGDTVLVNGVPFNRFEWVLGFARGGSTISGSEAAQLAAEIDRLRARLAAIEAPTEEVRGG